MAEKTSPIGHEISCVMYRINKKFFGDCKVLKKILLIGLKKEKFGILEISEYKFKPQAYSIIVLSPESHASIHTYPEYNSLVFHLYSCRGKGNEEGTLEFLKKKLDTDRIDLRENKIWVSFDKG